MDIEEAREIEGCRDLRDVLIEHHKNPPPGHTTDARTCDAELCTRARATLDKWKVEL